MSARARVGLVSWEGEVMQCCLWFRSVIRVRGPWPKRYGYHLSINLIIYHVNLDRHYVVFLLSIE